MELNIAKELAALQRMTVGQLRNRYAGVFGEPTNARNKQWLVRRIAWRIQALAEGDLSDRARQRAAELARDSDLRTSTPKAAVLPRASAAMTTTVPFGKTSDHRLPPPGSQIRRDYKGQNLLVTVLPHGFEFDGEVYKSLSAVAKHITGSHCNGYLFFGLTQGGDR